MITLISVIAFYSWARYAEAPLQRVLKEGRVPDSGRSLVIDIHLGILAVIGSALVFLIIYGVLHGRFV